MHNIVYLMALSLWGLKCVIIQGTLTVHKSKHFNEPRVEKNPNAQKRQFFKFYAVPVYSGCYLKVLQYTWNAR